MGWKVLQPVQGFHHAPAISITAAGRISWSPALDQAMGAPELIEVLYDGQKRCLGIRPGRDGAGTRVNRKERGIGARAMLSAAGLLEQLELPLGRIPAVLDEAEGIWSISVRSDGPFGKASKRRRKVEDIGDEPL